MTAGLSTTNYTSGVTNATQGTALGQFIAPDPTYVHSYFNDFDVYTVGDYTVTTTGSVTNAVIDGDGGILSMINSASNNDLDAIQLKKQGFYFANVNKQAWLKARFSLSSATNAAFVLGLQPTDTTPLVVTDGWYFNKAAASTTLSFITKASSTATTTTVGVLADATYVDVGAWYNGVDTTFLYLNGTQVASAVVTNIPATTTGLTLSWAVANGTAAAITLNLDYIFVAIER